MKKGKVAAAGMLGLAMLMGTPAVNVLAASPVAAVQQQTDSVTRGEFFAMLEQAIDLPNATAQRTYKDIVQGSELGRIVSKLHGAGVLNGYQDGTIRPSNAVKAGEAIALIGGALGIPDQPVPGATSPLPSKHWASNVAGWLAEANIDYDWNNLERTLSKQEAQALIQKILSTSSEAKKLLEESNKAQQNVKSFRVNGAMSYNMKFTEDAFADMSAEEQAVLKSMTGKGISMNIDGAFVMPDSMYMKMKMDMPIPGMGAMDMEQYMIGKDMYMKMPDTGSDASANPSGWMKMPNAFPMDMKAMMEQQMSGIPTQLEKKLFYRALGNEQLAFQGRIDKLTDLLPMMGGMQGMEEMTKSLTEAENVIGPIYMQGVMKLDPKTKMPTATNIQIVVSFKEGQEDMPIQQMVLTQKLTYSDYNGNVKVELPEAAKNAKEMPALKEAEKK